MAKCKVCGAPHKACGPSTTVIPIDERIQSRKQGDMSLKRYTIQSGRRGEHTITVKLTEEEAKRVGATTLEKTGKPASNKARTPANKAAPKKSTAKPEPSAPAKGVEEASDPGASE